MSAHDHADSHDSEAASVKMESPSAASSNGNRNDAVKSELSERTSRSPLPQKTSAGTDDVDMKDRTREEKVGGDIVVKQEPGQPPKLSRSSSQKVVPRPPQLFSHLPDSTEDALATFEQIEACWYANKYMGYTEHAMECDCAEEWGKACPFPSCAVRI